MIALWDWRRVFLTYLVSAAACGVALGGIVSVRLSQRFLGDLSAQSTARDTFAIDGSTALDWGDTLFAHDLAYALFLLGAATLAFFAFALRDPAAHRPRIPPACPLLLSIFGLGALISAHIDRALTTAQFDPSHVTASRMLEPFYAYDTLYQRGTLLLAVALALIWLGWGLLREDFREEQRAR